MDRRYREYRRDALVRGCVNTLAYTAVAGGFETIAEPEGRPEAAAVKARVDAMNAAVGLDWVLFVASVKLKVYGSVGFEIFPRFEEAWPRRLIPLRSDLLRPDVDEAWRLTGFTYGGVPGFYAAGDVLYFRNIGLEADMLGLSEVEPVLEALETRRAILGVDMREASRSLWAPMAVHTLTIPEHLPAEERSRVLDAYVGELKPGKSIVTDQNVRIQVADLKPDIPGLVQALEYLDMEVIGSFRVPRFILGRERQVNRATAEVEWRAFIEGPVADLQRLLRREVERQWYDRIVRKELGLGEEDPLPVRVKHVWNRVAAEDFYAMAQAIAQLWGGGLGPLGGNKRKVWDLMHWDPRELGDGGR